jgi:endo-1,4-beta-mannosidase
MSVIQLHPPSPQRDEPAPFRLGVNYWPAAKGPELFRQFDIDEVHCDMNIMAELGIDFVRVFLNWEDFQPDPDGVNCCALARLAALCDAAAAEGLKVITTLFTGHVLGHNWVPHWLLDPAAEPFGGTPVMSNGKRVTGGYREPLQDALARKAALRLVRAVAKTLSDHQALWAFDMGNAPDLISRPDDPSVLRDWYVELAGALRNLDAHHAVTCSVGAHALCSNWGFQLDDACASLTFASIGEQTDEFARITDRLDPSLLAFSCALASELTGKPCLSASWNLSTLPPSPEPLHTGSVRDNDNLVSERTAVEYAETALPALVAAGAVGAVVGNYSDFEPALFDAPPFDTRLSERYGGLWRADGTLKPHGRAIGEFAETNPSVQVPPLRRAHLDVSVDAYYADPLRNCRRLHQRFSSQDPACRGMRTNTPFI